LIVDIAHSSKRNDRYNIGTVTPLNNSSAHSVAFHGKATAYKAQSTSTVGVEVYLSHEELLSAALVIARAVAKTDDAIYRRAVRDEIHKLFQEFGGN
jgi:hypothetical protein